MRRTTRVLGAAGCCDHNTASGVVAIATAGRHWQRYHGGGGGGVGGNGGRAVAAAAVRSFARSGAADGDQVVVLLGMMKMLLQLHVAVIVA